MASEDHKLAGHDHMPALPKRDACQEIEPCLYRGLNHNLDSELSRLNRLAHRRPCPVSAETEAVMRQALRLSRASQAIKKGGIPKAEMPPR